MSPALNHEQLIARSFLLKLKRLHEDLRPLAMCDEDQEGLRNITETLIVLEDLLAYIENADEWDRVARIQLQSALLLPARESTSSSPVDDTWPLSP
jgi:hypothetical protein